MKTKTKQPTPRNLGEAWKQARLGCGLAQDQMAAALGVSDSYLSLIEANRRTPTIDLLRKMSGLTGWSMEKLSPDPLSAVSVEEPE
jgi:transcriptional regulator with XRE-family HTH domain